jgi:hypothetical protein
MSHYSLITNFEYVWIVHDSIYSTNILWKIGIAKGFRHEFFGKPISKIASMKCALLMENVSIETNAVVMKDILDHSANILKQ